MGRPRKTLRSGQQGDSETHDNCNRQTDPLQLSATGHGGRYLLCHHRLEAFPEFRLENSQANAPATCSREMRWRSVLPEGSTPRNSHVITQVERKWWVSFAGCSRAPGTSPVLPARDQEDTHRNFQRDVRLADAEQADDACHI